MAERDSRSLELPAEIVADVLELLEDLEERSWDGRHARTVAALRYALTGEIRPAEPAGPDALERLAGAAERIAANLEAITWRDYVDGQDGVRTYPMRGPS